MDEVRFDGRRALVIGGASGMGAAAAALLRRLGAGVTVLDHVDAGPGSLRVDLRSPGSIEAALGRLEGPLGVVLACAGVPDGPGVDEVNFIGQRELLEGLVARDLIEDPGAIGVISSLAGLGWEFEWSVMSEFLATPDFASAQRWIAEHPGRTGYRWSKMAASAYVAWRSYPLRRRGIRINAIQPGPTDTPMARANADTWLAHASEFRGSIGTGPSTAAEQVYPLVFLCSPVASHINGVNLVIDAGYTSAGMTGTHPAPAVQERMRVG